MSGLFSPMDPRDREALLEEEQQRAYEDARVNSAILDDEPPPEELFIRAPAWLVTFGDTTALMLAFFVLLFSMSHLQSERWDQIVSLIVTREKPQEDGEPTPVGTRTIMRTDLVPAFETGYLKRILTEKLEGDPELSIIQMTELDGQLVLSLPSDVLFEGSGVGLSLEGQSLMSQLVVIFRQFGNRMDIRGHRPPAPPGSDSGFDDNWSLSLSRAMVIAKALNDAGFGANMAVFGLSDSQFRSLDPSLSEAERFELADRIDIVMLPEARGQ